MGTTRELEGVGQAIGSMPSQNGLMGFLDDPGNARWMNGLVEDIRYALMDYQVCASKRLTLVDSNIYPRLHYNRTSMTRAVKRL